ncbi:MAG: sigma-70 family RNA polymerase sigma factor [Pirellulaceae bacterium]
MTNVYRDAAKKQKRDELVLEHMEYVRQICGTLAKRLPDVVDLQNLQSAGIVGLIEAAQNFDESRGVAFKTFSYPRIRGAIIDEIRRNSPLSQRIMNAVSKVRKAIENMEPPATPELIAEATGMSLDEVDECLAAMRIANPQSWDESGNVPGSNSSVESRLEREEQVRLLADAIEQLPDRDQSVVQMYYLEELRLREIGVILGISESRVSRILARAELQLREAIRRMENASQ